MKTLVLLLLSLYRTFLSPLVHSLLGVSNACRFEESCSSYAITVVKQYGVGKGLVLATRRLLSCQPFTKISYA